MENIAAETKRPGLKNPAPNPNSTIEVFEALTRKQIRQFIELPRSIYTDPNSPYVMPLEMHIKMMMGKVRVPEKHFLLAFSENVPVARLGIKIHRHSGKTHLHFGFFECLEGYPQAALALFQAAQNRYPDFPVMGPFHFRQEDPYVGVLVEGFQYQPYFLMPYNPPYYNDYLEAAGLKTAMDLYTYGVSQRDELPARIVENAREAYSKGITIRWLNQKQLRKEARIIASIFNDALKDNWGYEEFLDEQVNEMVTLFKLFIDPRVVAFAQKDGKDVGCLIMIPNYNPLIKPCQGRVTPGLLWRFLRNRKKIEEIRGYALGVLKEYHGLGVGSALTDAMREQAGKTGYYTCEISWILANNGPMNELSKAMGGKQNKVYRIYEKAALIDGKDTNKTH